jgi:hypothetical protein
MYLNVVNDQHSYPEDLHWDRHFSRMAEGFSHIIEPNSLDDICLTCEIKHKKLVF